MDERFDCYKPVQCLQTGVAGTDRRRGPDCLIKPQIVEGLQQQDFSSSVR